jgi:hypothetical protein
VGGKAKFEIWNLSTGQQLNSDSLFVEFATTTIDVFPWKTNRNISKGLVPWRRGPLRDVNQSSAPESDGLSIWHRVTDSLFSHVVGVTA